MSIRPRCTLLVVEDNPADVSLLRYALAATPLPIDLHAVRDGAEAMAFLRREGVYTIAPRPQLVLLDLNLPKEHGHTILAEIRAQPQFKQLPIIIWSSSANPDDIALSYKLGANAYLTKPLGLEDFLTTVRQLVELWCQLAVLPSTARQTT